MSNNSKKDGWLAATEHAGLPMIGTAVAPLIAASPSFTIAWISIVGAYGVYLQYNRDKVENLVHFIQAEIDKFPKEIVESKEFQDGFLVFFDNWIKTRSESKQEIAKKMLLGLASAEDKEAFELERYFYALSNISIEAIKHLKFIEDVISPIREESINERVNDLKLTDKSPSREWWIQHHEMDTPISRNIDDWIHDELSPNGSKAKDRWNYDAEKDENNILLQKIFDIEKRERSKIEELNTELVNIGVFRFKAYGEKSGTFDGGGGVVNQFYFTQFGKRFLVFLKK